MSAQMGSGMTGDVTSDDKLWAMLCYVFPVLGSILVLVMQDKKDRPFIKAHYVQALILGVLVWVVGGITVCGWLPLWIYSIYLGFSKAYQGQMVTIPVLTDFVKNQGWA